jgi:hypothetical protein
MCGFVTVHRFLALLLTLGLMFGPVAMPSWAAMPDHPAMASGSHCADLPAPAQKKAPENCCVVTCAALPALGGHLIAPAAPGATLPRLPLLTGRDGLRPDAETPPPRLS